MDKYNNIGIFKRIVIDIPATSKRLKELRESHGFSVRQLQELFGFEYPVAIYEWENENSKKLPRLENLHMLAKLYGLHVDELYVATEVEWRIGVSDVICECSVA